jgi:hypothetical protein
MGVHARHRPLKKDRFVPLHVPSGGKLSIPCMGWASRPPDHLPCPPLARSRISGLIDLACLTLPVRLSQGALQNFARPAFGQGVRKFE